MEPVEPPIRFSKWLYVNLESYIFHILMKHSFLFELSVRACSILFWFYQNDSNSPPCLWDLIWPSLYLT